MGGSFKPDIGSTSQLGPDQLFINQKFGSLLNTFLNQSLGSDFGLAGRGFLSDLQGIRSETAPALKELLSGQPQDLRSFFNKGILDPALRGFEQEISPRINQQFAGLGASFGNRRAVEQSRVLGDIQTNAQSQFAGIQASARESAKNRQLQAVGIPLQQTLGQISGLGSLGQQTFNPLQNFLSGTTNALSATPGVGAQLLQGLGAAPGVIGAYKGLK